MGETDWAIVVGIQSYPEMPDLEGPDNDAQAFYDWLVNERGGAVPRDQAKLIITPKDKIPFRNPEKATPAYKQIESEAYKLIKLAKEKPLKDGHKYIGRRLYMYYAGHGFSPREEQTALIMANANSVRIGAGFHWLGQWTAEWFFQAGYFDEIVLLMDCCRNYLSVVPSWPWSIETAPDFQQRVKRFYAFATRWGLEARGERDKNGKVHGIFTQVLLDGLCSYGNTPNTDVVTTDSLSVYIRSKIPVLQPSDFKLDSFELAKVSQRVYGFPVSVIVPPQAVGKDIEVITYTNGVPNTVCSDVAPAERWLIRLEKGFYLAKVPELHLEKLFSVVSSEVPNVEFK
jgi:hypothetical protein